MAQEDGEGGLWLVHHTECCLCCCFLLCWSPWKLQVPSYWCAAPSSPPSLPPCLLWLPDPMFMAALLSQGAKLRRGNCLSKHGKRWDTTGLSPFQSQGREFRQGGIALALERSLGIGHKSGRWVSCEKKEDQSEVCKVLQNVTKDLQRKSHGGIGPWQCCSGLHVTPCSWCIIHSFCVMTFKLLWSSKF